MKKTVAVIGAAGRVGLPFCLSLADKGYNVVGIDLNKDRCSDLNNGLFPYIEFKGEELLNKHRLKNVYFTTSHDAIPEADFIAIMVGTPVDEEGNPRLDDIKDVVKSIIDYDGIKKGAVVLLRSTVSPGTTDLLKELFMDAGFWEGEDFHLVFAPERTIEGKSILEFDTSPQLIGAYSDAGYNAAKELFKDSFQLTPKEAEVAKLVTNMYRYINFAFANEVYMIASQLGCDTHKIINSANWGYPRMNMPLPGANVGGPCLFKDGKFLTKDIPYADLIDVAFKINEGVPDYLWKQIKEKKPLTREVWILGMTFKKGSDDIRHSLSFKMKKVLEREGIRVKCYDPHWNRKNDIDLSDFTNYPDAIIIMTPHSEFEYAFKFWENMPDKTLIVDMWKAMSFSYQTESGIYFMEEIE